MDFAWAVPSLSQTVMLSDETEARATSDKVDVLGAFCASRCDINARDGFLTSLWKNHRVEAISELGFFHGIFFRTTVLEALPVLLAGPLSLFTEGKATAQARQLWPPGIALDVLVYIPAWYVSVASWTAGLAVGLQNITVFANMVARALTIGTKYAHYGHRDLICRESGMTSQVYSKTQRIVKNQISQILFNLNGHQLGVLAEQVYASSLVKDTNLACSHVKFSTPKEAQNLLDRVMKHFATIEAIDKKELKHMMNQKEHQTTGKVADLEAVAPISNDASSKQASGTSRLLLHSKYSEKVGLFSLLLNGKSRDEIEKMAASGKLPSSFVALDATWSSHHIDQKIGSKFVVLPLLISFCLNFLPFLVDGAMGYEAFGTTAIEKSFAVAGIFPGAFFQWLIFMYAWGPAYFQFLSTKREQYLYAMIGGENLDGRASAKVAPPRLDLTDPSNIIAFSAIYRVLHGNNFARSMQKRFSMYLVVTFSIIVFGATKSVFSEQYGITVEGRIGDKISSIVILCIFVSFVSLQVVAAWTVNDFTKRHLSAISQARITNLAFASVEMDAERKEILLTAEALLDGLSNEISSEDECNPVRVAFFRANIALLSSISGILSAILIYDLRALAKSLGIYDS